MALRDKNTNIAHTVLKNAWGIPFDTPNAWGSALPPAIKDILKNTANAPTKSVQKTKTVSVKKNRANTPFPAMEFISSLRLSTTSKKRKALDIVIQPRQPKIKREKKQDLSENEARTWRELIQHDQHVPDSGLTKTVFYRKLVHAKANDSNTIVNPIRLKEKNYNFSSLMECAPFIHDYAMTLLHNGKTQTYEVARENTTCRFFIDFDSIQETLLHDLDLLITISQILEACKEVLVKKLPHSNELQVALARVVVLSGSRQETNTQRKESLHIIFPDIVFPTIMDIEHVVLQVKDTLISQGHNVTGTAIDGKVKNLTCIYNDIYLL